MRVAYLIDRDSIGGGMEYVRRQILATDCLSNRDVLVGYDQWEELKL